jgi:hypothetical protein
VTRYQKLASPDEIAFDILNTTIPPKDVFFPHTEKMFDVKMKKGVATDMTEAALPMGPSILFGMRPCDAYSLTYMDALFNWEGVEDTYWNRRRKLVTIFVMGCNRLCPNSFCTSMGSGPDSRDNADVFMYEFEDRLILDPVTDKGRDTLKKLGLDEAGEEDLAAQAQAECGVVHGAHPGVLPLVGAHIDGLNGRSHRLGHGLLQGPGFPDHRHHQAVVIFIALIVQQFDAFFCPEGRHDFFDFFQVAALAEVGYAFDKSFYLSHFFS